MRLAFLRAKWSISHPAVWWVLHTHFNKNLKQHWVLCNGADHEDSFDKVVKNASDVEIYLAAQPKEHTKAAPSHQTHQQASKPRASAAPVTGTQPGGKNCEHCGNKGHATSICRAKYSVDEWKGLSQAQCDAHVREHKEQRAKASVSQISGKQTIAPQPADSDSESDQANVNAVTSRLQKGKGRASAAPMSKSLSPPPSEAEWKMAKSWSSCSNKSLLANDPPSAAIWAQEKLARLRDSTRAKANLEISVARAAAARAEESRKRKEAAVAKARSIQDELDAVRKAQQQRFSPDMASFTTATASSGTGPSSTSRVPVSTSQAPGSQGGSDAEMRGLMMSQKCLIAHCEGWVY
jgi:hypothetical protein